MPNTKAAKKALRQSDARRVHNLRKKRDLLGIIKDYKKAIESGQEQEAATKLPNVYKKLDKAAKANLIKPNKASRLKSRLAKKLKGKTTAQTKDQTEDQQL